jgi:hypothetical protein
MLLPDGGVPPQGDAGPQVPAGQTGAPCSQDSNCTQGPQPLCITQAFDFNNGYCTSSCTSNAQCGTGNPCVANTGFTTTSGTPISVCLEGCTTDADCRAGYYCLDFQGQSFCWNDCKNDNECIQAGETCNVATGRCSTPGMNTDAGMTGGNGDGGTPPPTDAGPYTPPGPGQTGAPCSGRRGSCTEGPGPYCFTAQNDWPNGYCSSSCSTDSDCGAGNICETGAIQDQNGDNIAACLEGCGSNADCRSGYNCLTYQGQDFCFLKCQSSADCIDVTQTCDPATGLCTGEMLAGGGSPYDAGPPPADAGQPPPPVDAGPPPPVVDGGPYVTVPLTGCAFIGYQAEVKIAGSQTFLLSIDTGSTDTAVAASSCSDCGVSPVYMPSAGADTGMNTSTQYGSGSWNAEVYSDTVQVGGEVPAVRMDFAGITEQRQFFTNQTCDGSPSATSPTQGILGLGPLTLDTIGMSNTDAYFNELVQVAGIPNVFAVQLCALNGNMWFGGYDPGYASGAPQYTPMVSSGYYAVTLSDVGLGGTSLGYSSSDYGAAVVDTGTWGFLLPTGAFNALANDIASSSAVSTVFGGQINANFFDTGNCATPNGETEAQVNSMLPAMTITFPSTTGGSFTLSYPAARSYLVPITQGGQTQYCAGIGDASSVGTTILGASALSAFITVFDAANGRVGFAPDPVCP